MTADNPRPGLPLRQNLFPVLRYIDAPAAIDWLIRVFGFEKHLVIEGPDGTIAHAELALGAGVIMIGSVKRGELDDLNLRTPRQLGGNSQGLYVAIDDIDAQYARAKGAGAQIVIDIHDTNYGSRDYSCLDIEEHLWSFGSYRPGASS